MEIRKEKDFYQISLKLLLKNNKGETLILEAVLDGSLAGYYDLPGGRINTDEFGANFNEILKRETKEEIGDVGFQINPAIVAFGRHLIPSSISPSGKDVHVLYLFFEGEYINGDMKISNEHTDSKWVDLKKIELEKYFTSGILEGIQMYVEK